MITGSTAARVLEHLGAAGAPRSAEQVQYLVEAYARTVPWESASRIARHRRYGSNAECALWPEEFWLSHLQFGTGGTCFESNYALAVLLDSLGYGIAFTINDMGEQRSCHTALIVATNDGDFLVDVGIPVHAPIPFDPLRRTGARSAFHEYSLSPVSPDKLDLTRNNHPRAYVYTLNRTPVSETEYRTALVRDYDAHTGLFLDRIIVNKVVDGVQHRFCGSEFPLSIETFAEGTRRVEPLGAHPAREVASVFGIDEGILRAAGLE
jgi:arylamine N-acetyltransferase